MKKIIIGGVVIILAGIAGFLMFGSSRIPETKTFKTSLEQLKTFAVFSQPIEGVDTIGFANISPDGRYFAYSAFTRGGNPANQGHVVDLKTGEDKALGTMLSRGFRENNYLTLFSAGKSPVIYNAATGTIFDLMADENVFDAFVSPNGKLAVVNGNGAVVVNLETKAKKVLDDKPESMAWAWFSDNQKILGLKQNDENLFEAGKGRDLGIWDATTGEFTKLPMTFKVKSLRYIEWLVPDHVARVNAGYDDGSHDYLVNLDTQEVIDLAETSWALMGGIVIDQKLGLMAAIGGGGPGNCNYGECEGFVADATGKIAEFPMPRDRWRSSLQIISKNTLLYISRDLGEEGGYGTTYLASYDTATAKETKIQELPNMNAVTLSVSPDKKFWIVGAGDQFFLGSLE